MPRPALQMSLPYGPAWEDAEWRPLHALSPGHGSQHRRVLDAGPLPVVGTLRQFMEIVKSAVDLDSPCLRTQARPAPPGAGTGTQTPGAGGASMANSQSAPAV